MIKTKNLTFVLYLILIMETKFFKFFDRQGTRLSGIARKGSKKEKNCEKSENLQSDEKLEIFSRKNSVEKNHTRKQTSIGIRTGSPSSYRNSIVKFLNRFGSFIQNKVSDSSSATSLRTYGDTSFEEKNSSASTLEKDSIFSSSKLKSDQRAHENIDNILDSASFLEQEYFEQEEAKIHVVDDIVPLVCIKNGFVCNKTDGAPSVHIVNLSTKDGTSLK